jgi:hypothetical protein
MVDSSFTIVRVGIDYLKLERLNGNLGAFSGFMLGDNNGLAVDDQRTGIDGNLVYSGSITEMNYSKINQYEVILRCVVSEAIGDFNIGSFAILAGGIPFFIGSLPYLHKKQKTVGNVVGDRYTLQIRFQMYDLDANWSFANLSADYAAFDVTDTDISTAPDRPVTSLEYMIGIDTGLGIVDTHRRGFVLYPGTKGQQWRAPDLGMMHSDSNFWRVSGGQDGDGRIYVPNTP